MRQRRLAVAQLATAEQGTCPEARRFVLQLQLVREAGFDGLCTPFADEPMDPLSVAAVLSHEHALFRALLDSLESELRQPESRARSAVLLPALDRHEQIEDQVFLRAPDEQGNPRQAAAEVAEQHRKLGSLRADILRALEESQDEHVFAELTALTKNLIADLRTHLLTEETQLWPMYRSALARPLDAGAPGRFEQRALALERELFKGLAVNCPDGLGGPQERR
jgi:hypothetical protein